MSKATMQFVNRLPSIEELVKYACLDFIGPGEMPQPRADLLLQELLDRFGRLLDAMLVFHQREPDVAFAQRPEADAG